MSLDTYSHFAFEMEKAVNVSFAVCLSLVGAACIAGLSDASSVVVGSVLVTSAFSFHRWLVSAKRQAPGG